MAVNAALADDAAKVVAEKNSVKNARSAYAEAIESVFPDLAVALDPVDGGVERGRFHPAGPELGVLAPTDEPRVLRQGDEGIGRDDRVQPDHRRQHVVEVETIIARTRLVGRRYLPFGQRGH